MSGVDIGTSLLGHGQGIRGLRSLDYGLRRGGAGPASGGCHSLLGSFLRRFSGLPGGLFGRRSQFFRRYFCQLADLFGAFSRAILTCFSALSTRAARMRRFGDSLPVPFLVFFITNFPES